MEICLLNYKNFHNPCSFVYANHPLGLHLSMHGSFSRKAFIFVKVRFISLSRNRLIQTKKQSDCKMASKGGAYPYRRKCVKFSHCVELDKGTNYRLYKCSFRVHCYGSASRWSRRSLL